MNTIYRMKSEPIGFRHYAFFTEPPPHGKNYLEKCPKCGRAVNKSRISNPEFEYQPGVLADFYSGVGFLLATDSTKKILEQNFKEIDFAHVRILKNRQSNTCPMFEIRPEINMDFSSELGDFDILETCSECDRVFYKFRGVWLLETYAALDGEMAYKIVPPEIETGVVLPRSLFSGAEIFRFDMSFLLCTDLFKSFCQRHQFKNLAFIPYGHIVED